jgi:hypothetical protein
MPVLQIVLLAWGGEGLFRPSQSDSMRRVLEFVDKGRLIGLGTWLENVGVR